MKYRIVFAIVLLAVLSLRSTSEAPALVRADNSVAGDMRKLADEIFATYQKRDTEALKKFYAKQPDALFFWERKMTYSWAQLDATINALVKAAAKIDLKTTDFRSGGSGDTGWFAATFHIERISPDGQQSTSDGRWTVVAEKRDGRWLIVHEHTSFPLPKS
jgi:ketosteroid isomerase-like protein